MTAVQQHHFTTSDNVKLAWHEMGQGRPLLLLHGLFSNAQINWVKFGTAKRLAEAGFRCQMLDFRAHGGSGGDPSAEWPANVLARDVAEWVQHLGHDEYDLGGFSLGARTAVHAVINGLAPRRLAICGMGLRGITDQTAGTDWFIDAVSNRAGHSLGSEEYFAVQFMKTNKVDPDAALRLLRAQVDADEQDIAAIDIPTGIICATDDRFYDDARALQELMPTASFTEIPGTHMSCVSKPEFGAALVDFLTA
ncbi:alpha/beta fold hydrolase [Pacificimonas sp. ICDLI1SI03]